MEEKNQPVCPFCKGNPETLVIIGTVFDNGDIKEEIIIPDCPNCQIEVEKTSNIKTETNHIKN